MQGDIFLRSSEKRILMPTFPKKITWGGYEQGFWNNYSPRGYIKDSLNVSLELFEGVSQLCFEAWDAEYIIRINQNVIVTAFLNFWTIFFWNHANSAPSGRLKLNEKKVNYKISY